MYPCTIIVARRGRGPGREGGVEERSMREDRGLRIEVEDGRFGSGG
jgi:hypothetical protein